MTAITIRTFCLLPPSFLAPRLHIRNSDSVPKAQSLLLPAKNCLLTRNWRSGMTVILASLAVDCWHGLFLPRRMNTSRTVCRVLPPSPCTNKEIMRKESGIRARDRCTYPLFAEPCWEMPNPQRTAVTTRPAALFPLPWPRQPWPAAPCMPRCGSWLSYFPGRGELDQNPACVFPEIQVFFKIICFSLEGS